MQIYQYKTNFSDHYYYDSVKFISLIQILSIDPESNNRFKYPYTIIFLRCDFP